MKVILGSLLLIHAVSCIPAMYGDGNMYGGDNSASKTTEGCEDQRSIYCLFMRSCFVTTFLEKCSQQQYLREVCAKSCQQCESS